MKKFKCILLVLLVWLLVFAFVSMVAQVRADPDVWPMFHHDLQHTGSSDSAVSNGVLLWQFSTGDVIRCSPAVVDGVVYIGSNNDYFYALDAVTGASIWQTNVGSNLESSPT